jgi:hypothetical protein
MWRYTLGNASRLTCVVVVVVAAAAALSPLRAPSPPPALVAMQAHTACSAHCPYVTCDTLCVCICCLDLSLDLLACRVQRSRERRACDGVWRAHRRSGRHRRRRRRRHWRRRRRRARRGVRKGSAPCNDLLHESRTSHTHEIASCHVIIARYVATSGANAAAVAAAATSAVGSGSGDQRGCARCECGFVSVLLAALFANSSAPFSLTDHCAFWSRTACCRPIGSSLRVVFATKSQRLRSARVLRAPVGAEATTARAVANIAALCSFVCEYTDFTSLSPIWQLYYRVICVPPHFADESVGLDFGARAAAHC